MRVTKCDLWKAVIYLAILGGMALLNWKFPNPQQPTGGMHGGARQRLIHERMMQKAGSR